MSGSSRLRTIEEIDRLIDDGATVAAVETLLDSLPIDGDQKSALWLKAWHHSEGQPRRGSVPGQYFG